MCVQDIHAQGNRIIEHLEVLLERWRMESGGNGDDHLRMEEELKALVVNVEEVVEAENTAADKIATETLGVVYHPCLFSTTTWLIKKELVVKSTLRRIFWE